MVVRPFDSLKAMVLTDSPSGMASKTSLETSCSFGMISRYHQLNSAIFDGLARSNIADQVRPPDFCHMRALAPLVIFRFAIAVIQIKKCDLTRIRTITIVRYMPNQQAAFNQVFQALADPTRRAVIERLSQGPSAVSELAAPFQMALPSFMQHLEVLSDCGLVRSTKSGRVRTFELEPQPLQELEGWLLAQRNIWEQRLDQLDAYLLDLKKESEKPKN